MGLNEGVSRELIVLSRTDSHSGPEPVANTEVGF